MSQQKRNYDLTPTQLRLIKGYEEVSDQDAHEVVFYLKELSLILYNLYALSEDDKPLKKPTYEKHWR